MRLTTLPLSYVDCREIWELQSSGTLMACTVIALPFNVSITINTTIVVLMVMDNYLW